MTDVAHSIDLDLATKLQDAGYRQRFFLAEASAHIAAQLIALRKRRDLSQKEVAQLTGTRQPAISRAEQADYQNWSFNTLRSIADALDARIRVLIEPSEDVLGEYEDATVAEPGQDAESRAVEQLWRRLLAPAKPRRREDAAEKPAVVKVEVDWPKASEQKRSEEHSLLGKGLGHLFEGIRFEDARKEPPQPPKRLGDKGGQEAWIS